MAGVLVIIAVVVGGLLIGYGIGEWWAAALPLLPCGLVSGKLWYDAATYNGNGDDSTGLVLFVVLVGVLPAWILTTAAGVWLSKRRQNRSPADSA